MIRLFNHWLRWRSLVQMLFDFSFVIVGIVIAMMWVHNGLPVNHTQVLLTIARNPDIRTREIAEAVGITERAAQRIVADLVEVKDDLGVGEGFDAVEALLRQVGGEFDGGLDGAPVVVDDFLALVVDGGDGFQGDHSYGSSTMVSGPWFLGVSKTLVTLRVATSAMAILSLSWMPR